MRIVIATIKSWNIENAKRFIGHNSGNHEIKLITNKDELSEEYLCEFKPNYIFFPHWSYIIPKTIYDSYNCVVFHMTDLPYGRGGSPLQNLIVRGHKDTKISAIKVTKGLDEGPVYFKEDLKLDGSADDIFKRASEIIFSKMIPRFLDGVEEPTEQIGEVVVFKRRRVEDGEIKPNFSLEEIYDYIRMLDAEGYPHAFFKYGDYKIELMDGSKYGDVVEAKVVIRRENNE